MDLQDAKSPLATVLPHHEAPPRLSGASPQAFVGPTTSPLSYAHSNPVTPQPRAALRDGQPQSVPQARRPLQPSLSQHRSLQPLSFQNPVYHLTNPAHRLSTHSSSENLSTESSHCSHSNCDDLSSQLGVKGRTASNSSLEELGSRQSVHSEERSAPRRHPLPDLPPGVATAVAIPRQSTTAGTAHIVKVEKRNRAGGGSRMQRSIPQSASLRSSSSANTDPAPTTGHVPCQQSPCSVENVAPPPRSTAQQPVQVLLQRETLRQNVNHSALGV